MPDAATWAGLGVAAITMLIVWLLYVAVLKVAEWTIAARDELRDRYGNDCWQPHGVDVILIPMWLAIEITCLVAGLVVMLFIAWAAYDTARQFRDWWHAGDSNR